MEAVFIMFKADGQTRSFPLARDVTVIGRREDCDLRIPLTEVSRKHCRVVKEGDALRIEDLGSSNGTFQNGQRVQEALLQPGDYVQIGPVLFAVQIAGVPAIEEIQPPQPSDVQHSPSDSVSPQAATITRAAVPGDSDASGSTQATNRPATPSDLPLPPDAADDLFVVADDVAKDPSAVEDDLVDFGDSPTTGR